MPFTRVGVDTQMAHVVKGMLAPDERVLVAMLTAGGPSPYLYRWLSVLALPFTVHLYITLTDKRVIVHRLEAVDNTVRSLAFADPCDAVEITSVRRRPLWSSLRYRSPSVPKSIRLNIHRRKRGLMDEMVRHLTPARAGETAGSAP